MPGNKEGIDPETLRPRKSIRGTNINRETHSRDSRSREPTFAYVVVRRGFVRAIANYVNARQQRVSCRYERGCNLHYQVSPFQRLYRVSQVHSATF